MTATIVLFIIAALLALSVGLLFVLPWAVRRAECRRQIRVERYCWTPFDENGHLRNLEAEGWHYLGAMTEDGIK